MPGISEMFKPLEDCIGEKLIPTIMGRAVCSNLQRDVLSLPARLGGLSINYPTESDVSFQLSVKIVAPLTDKIVRQDIYTLLLSEETAKIKAKTKN